MNTELFRIERLTALDEAILQQMADIYVEAYAEPPYNAGPLWDREAFLARTRRQRDRDGFQLELARSGSGDLIGFAFGFTMPADGWWAGSTTEPPPAVQAARKFAFIELVVQRRWRGNGIGRALHDTILNTRLEPYAILTALAEAPARAMYERWGWIQIGSEQHTTDSPLLDSLVLDRTQQRSAD
ncbi:GNAT family N-acetyltransferase [Dactylosporangium salmoneum]|uniref:N-acetyltransferase domain-containing protein n=1 Tax=Dactylosporangium salmoneum TaxID=53361 RepID=A0ABP5SMT4_9ACTN